MSSCAGRADYPLARIVSDALRRRRGVPLLPRGGARSRWLDLKGNDNNVATIAVKLTRRSLQVHHDVERELSASMQTCLGLRLFLCLAIVR